MENELTGERAEGENPNNYEERRQAMINDLNNTVLKILEERKTLDTLLNYKNASKNFDEFTTTAGNKMSQIIENGYVELGFVKERVEEELNNNKEKHSIPNMKDSDLVNFYTNKLIKQIAKKASDQLITESKNVPSFLENDSRLISQEKRYELENEAGKGLKEPTEENWRKEYFSKLNKLKENELSTNEKEYEEIMKERENDFKKHFVNEILLEVARNELFNWYQKK